MMKSDIDTSGLSKKEREVFDLITETYRPGEVFTAANLCTHYYLRRERPDRYMSSMLQCLSHISLKLDRAGFTMKKVSGMGRGAITKYQYWT